MKNQRQYKEWSNPDFSWCKREEANALFRCFGNSSSFPYAGLTSEVEKINLKDCSVYPIFIHNEKAHEVFSKFSYADLIFTAMAGETDKINPHGVKVPKHSIEIAYDKYKDY